METQMWDIVLMFSIVEFKQANIDWEGKTLI